MSGPRPSPGTMDISIRASARSTRSGRARRNGDDNALVVLGEHYRARLERRVEPRERRLHVDPADVVKEAYLAVRDTFRNSVDPQRPCFL